MPIGEELNIDDSMQEIYKEINAPEAEITPVEDEQEIEEKVDDEKHPRGEDGKFVAKEEDTTDVDVDETSVDDTQPEESVEETAEVSSETEEIPQELVNPPASWTAPSKAKWGNLPVWARQEVFKRENEAQKGVSMVQERATYGDRMSQVVQPYMATINASGSTPEQTVQSMLNTAYQLQTGTPQSKAQLTLNLAQQYGYLNELVASITQDGQNVQQQGQLNQVIAPLQQQVQQLQQTIQQQQTQSQQAAQSEAEQDVQRFSEDVDETGQLRHPYFENVRDLMASLIESGQAADFEEAYDRAIWSSPETRELVQAQQVSSQQTQSQVEAKERADKARKAQRVNVETKGTHDSGQPQTPTGTVDDTMQEVLEQIKARG